VENDFDGKQKKYSIRDSVNNDKKSHFNWINVLTMNDAITCLTWQAVHNTLPSISINGTLQLSQCITVFMLLAVV